MQKLYCLLITAGLYISSLYGQHAPVNSKQFFLDDSIINVTLTTDIKQLRSKKANAAWQPANIKMNFADTFVINEQIRVEQRGVDRKAHCDLASLMLDFKNSTSPLLSPLNKLKLVGSCYTGNTNEEYLLKEFLIYKIYNLLSEMSFRVRLLHITYNDSRQKTKPFSQYAFLLENIKDVAARNNCIEIKNKRFAWAALNRYQITFMSIFQYMIGNTDWHIGNYHNIKLMVPKNDTLARPYPVPYDFDFAGLVNAPYAMPDENTGLENVTQRFYMGYPRSSEELEIIINVFEEKKQSILLMVQNFYLLNNKAAKTVSNYIEDFYKIAEDKKEMKSAFIDKAL